MCLKYLGSRGVLVSPDLATTGGLYRRCAWGKEREKKRVSAKISDRRSKFLEQAIARDGRSWVQSGLRGFCTGNYRRL